MRLGLDINITNNKRFNNYVISDIIENTTRKQESPFHWYLFDCNISVFLNHRYVKPIFDIVPECFYYTMLTHYGLDKIESDRVWGWYSNHIIDLYLRYK